MDPQTVALLDKLNIVYSPYMVAVLALMEIPSILMSVAFYTSSKGESLAFSSWSTVLKSKSVFLLIGSFCVGFLVSKDGWDQVEGFYSESIFYGILSFFLLDMGITVGNRLLDHKFPNFQCVLACVVFQLFSGVIGLCVALALGLEFGDAMLLIMLCGSSSYIAAPAAIKVLVPEANEAIYVTMPLCITFPINMLCIIPMYLYLLPYFIQS